MANGSASQHDLIETLRQSRTLGFLAAATIATAFSGRGLDLGAGGGVPGLVLAIEMPGSRWVLLDAGQRRTAFLEQAVDRLGLGHRVEVVRARAEVAGHELALRGTFELVIARSFGPPAVVAECASPMLKLGGLLVVSEPPDRTTAHRWPPEELEILGLEPVVSGHPSFACLRQAGACPDRFPRRVGVPAKRPLF